MWIFSEYFIFFSEYGPAVIDHVLSKVGLAGTLRPIEDVNAKGFYITRDMPSLVNALTLAEEMMTMASTNTSKVFFQHQIQQRPLCHM